MMEIENKKFRCHWSIILEKTGSVLVIMALLIINNFSDLVTVSEIGGSTDELMGMLVIGGIMLGITTLVVVLAFLRWRKTTITIEEDAIVWEKDTINKETLTIGIKNISSINIERNIFERIIGTAKLKLDTDSYSTADATDVEFVFKYEDAVGYKEYLEAKVRGEAGKYGVVPNPVGVATTENKMSTGMQTSEDSPMVNGMQSVDGRQMNIGAHPVEGTQMQPGYGGGEQITGQFTSDFEEILKHCVFDLNISSLVVAIPILVLAIAGVVMMAIEGELGTTDILAALIQIGAFGYAAAYAIIGKLFRYYNLTVSRQGNRIYMKYGMFKVREYVIPVQKINAIHIKQTLIGRIFKRYNVSMECVGVGDDNNEIAQLTLSLKLPEVKERLALLLPEYDLTQLDKLQHIDKRAIWHKLMRLVWLAFFAVCINVGIVIGVNMFDELGLESLDTTFWIIDAIIVGVAFVWVLIHAILQLGVEAVGFGDNHLIMATGTYSKDITMLSYEKIQYVTTKKTPISNISGLVRGQVNILAGILGTTKIVPYMYFKQVEMLAEKICER